MLHRSPIAVAQVKPDNTSYNFLNEIKQTIYLIHRLKEIPKEHIIVPSNQFKMDT